MRRPIYILYILVFYIFFQFIWWAYLLIDLNDEVYRHKIENVTLQNFPPEEKKKQIILLQGKINQRRWMVYGEGGVFLSLLFYGTLITLRSFRKEIGLASQQRNFLLSITHEFKSPLASIKLYLQTLLKHDLEKDKQTSFINSAIADTERLHTLVENALLANLIDHNGYKFSKEEINFSAFTRLLVQRFQQMPEHNKIVSVISDGLSVYGDKNALMIMFTNLIENAFKYSSKESNIKVEAIKKDDNVILSISDEGIGIPDKEKSKIFGKFYRIGNEETRRTIGTGLGLFIVRYVVEEHKGKIEVSDNIPHGTVFSVFLPTIKLQ